MNATYDLYTQGSLVKGQISERPWMQLTISIPRAVWWNVRSQSDHEFNLRSLYPGQSGERSDLRATMNSTYDLYTQGSLIKGQISERPWIQLTISIPRVVWWKVRSQSDHEFNLRSLYPGQSGKRSDLRATMNSTYDLYTQGRSLVKDPLALSYYVV